MHTICNLSSGDVKNHRIRAKWYYRQFLFSFLMYFQLTACILINWGQTKIKYNYFFNNRQKSHSIIAKINAFTPFKSKKKYLNKNDSFWQNWKNILLYKTQIWHVVGSTGVFYKIFWEQIHTLTDRPALLLKYLLRYLKWGRLQKTFFFFLSSIFKMSGCLPIWKMWGRLPCFTAPPDPANNWIRQNQSN